jgi:hypothetical protein
VAAGHQGWKRCSVAALADTQARSPTGVATRGRHLRVPALWSRGTLMRRLAVVLGLVVGFVALWTEPAVAAHSIPVGAGSQAAVAIDSAGTAYIAFNGTEPSNAKLHFCRLPRGATLCATAMDLPVPASGDSLTRPFISVSGSTVQVLSYRYGTPVGARDFLFTSTDGGASFGAPVAVGDLQFNGDAVAGPGGGVSLVNSSAAAHRYQRVPADGSAPAATSATLSTSYLYGGAVGLVGASTPLVAFDDGASTPTAAFSVFSGAGNVNDGGNWSAPQAIGTGSHERLASGPGGLFLMLDPGGRLEVRKYGTTTFGAPTAIPNSQPSGGEHLFQDGAGMLHAAWTDASGTVWYARSADGTGWDTQQVVAAGAGPTDPRLAAATDHEGFAVYVLGTGAGATVRAVPIGPPPPPPPPGRIGADFTWSPGTPCTDVDVSFSGAASAALSQDPIVHYTWMFDNTYVSSGGRVVAPTFDGGASPSAGTVYGPNRRRVVQGEFALFITTYRDPASVTLTVTDSQGRTATVTKAIAFGDPQREYSTSTLNPFAALFASPQPDPIALCRTQTAIRTVGATFGHKPTAAATATVSATVACPAGQTGCQGFFGVISDRPRGIPRAAAKKARRPTTLGATQFRLHPGQRKTIKVKITKRGRRIIRSKHLNRVTAVLLTIQPRGRVVHTAVVKLKIHKKSGPRR